MAGELERGHAEVISQNFDLTQATIACRESAFRQLYGQTAEYKIIENMSERQAVDVLVEELLCATAKTLIEQAKKGEVHPERIRAFCDLVRIKL